MKLYAGTSGFSYAPWKGPFYPKTIRPQEMLAYYAEHFPTVEINSSFYKVPLAKSLQDWASQVPEDFLFTFKAPGAVTHRRWNATTEATLDSFIKVTSILKKRCGPLLFQFPPFLKKDLEMLKKLLALIPKKVEAAFEFRNASWFDDDTYAQLKSRAYPLVFNDADVDDMPFVATAPTGYLRLRKTEYTDKELKARLAECKKQKWESMYVFFKHEDKATAPELVRRVMDLRV